MTNPVRSTGAEGVCRCLILFFIGSRGLSAGFGWRMMFGAVVSGITGVYGRANCRIGVDSGGWESYAGCCGTLELGKNTNNYQ